MLAGWASNNKYSLLGSLRALHQMVAYEIPMILSVVGVVVLSGSLDLVKIVDAQSSVWFILFQPLGAIVFFICVLAELERIPFDLPEADSELVAGWQTEYGGMNFGVFQLATYIKFYALSGIFTTFFLGGWFGPGVLPPAGVVHRQDLRGDGGDDAPEGRPAQGEDRRPLEGRVDEAHAPRLPEPLRRAPRRLARALHDRRRLSAVGTLSSIKGAWIATWSGIRHVFRPRMTLRYPDQKLDLQGPGYHFDPKNGVGPPRLQGQAHAPRGQVHRVPALRDSLRRRRGGHRDADHGEEPAAEQEELLARRGLRKMSPALHAHNY